METNLTDKVPRLQFRMIDVVRARQLVWKAVVIIEFDAHADGTAKVSRMKQFSKYNRADIHWLNEDTKKSSLNACQTNTQRRTVISLLAVSEAELEKSETARFKPKRRETAYLRTCLLFPSALQKPLAKRNENNWEYIVSFCITELEKW